MRKIVYTDAQGNTCIVHPVINTLGEAEGFTEAEAEFRAFSKLPYAAISPRFINADQIPTDRTFRNAWKADLSVDMGKARDIYRDRLRWLRKPFLEALDIEYQRADETKDEARKAEIVAKKNILRDVTNDPAIEAAATPEELKAVLPDVLKSEAVGAVDVQP